MVPGRRRGKKDLEPGRRSGLLGDDRCPRGNEDRDHPRGAVCCSGPDLAHVLLGLGRLGVGIEVRTGRRHHGAHVLAPRNEPGVQPPHRLGMSRSEVVLLAQVLGKIVKLERSILAPLDELPVALANDSVRPAALVAVMKVMPEEWFPAFERFASGERHDAETVEVPLTRLLGRVALGEQSSGRPGPITLPASKKLNKTNNYKTNSNINI